MRPTTHPQKRSRQERALAQRQAELQAWESGEVPPQWRQWPWISDEDKTEKCKKEIRALEKKGVK